MLKRIRKKLWLMIYQMMIIFVALIMKDDDSTGESNISDNKNDIKSDETMVKVFQHNKSF